MANSTAKILGLLVVAAFCIVSVQMAPRVGGLGDELAADDEVRTVVERVRESIQAKYPEPFTRIEPLSYKVQVVAGKNYFVKAIFHENDGDKIVAHLRIYKGFRGNAELTALRLKVKPTDPLVHFD